MGTIIIVLFFVLYSQFSLIALRIKVRMLIKLEKLRDNLLLPLAFCLEVVLYPLMCSVMAWDH